MPYRGAVTVYAIAQLTIHDQDRYQRYVEGFLPVLAMYNGTLLAADYHPEVFEGHWEGSRVVLMAFPDREAFGRWAASPEYRAILPDRLAAADTVALVVRGLPGG